MDRRLKGPPVGFGTGAAQTYMSRAGLQTAAAPPCTECLRFSIPFFFLAVAPLDSLFPALNLAVAALPIRMALLMATPMGAAGNNIVRNASKIRVAAGSHPQPPAAGGVTDHLRGKPVSMT